MAWPWLVAALALMLAAPALAQADGRVVDWEQVTSNHVQPRNITIWLPLGDPREGQGAGPESVASAFGDWLADRRVRPARNRLYLDWGDQTLDAYYPPYAAALLPVLERRGWRQGRGLCRAPLPRHGA